MKIKQKETFEPITITLETKQEAVALWDIVNTIVPGSCENKDAVSLSIEISNYFSNKSQM